MGVVSAPGDLLPLRAQSPWSDGPSSPSTIRAELVPALPRSPGPTRWHGNGAGSADGHRRPPSPSCGQKHKVWLMTSGCGGVFPPGSAENTNPLGSSSTPQALAREVCWIRSRRSVDTVSGSTTTVRTLALVFGDYTVPILGRHHAVVDSDRCRTEVHIGPSKGADLPSAHASSGDDPDDRSKTRIEFLCGRNEDQHLLDGWSPKLLSLFDRPCRELGVGDRVEKRAATPFASQSTCTVHHGSCLADRCLGQTFVL